MNNQFITNQSSINKLNHTIVFIEVKKSEISYFYLSTIYILWKIKKFG